MISHTGKSDQRRDVAGKRLRGDKILWRINGSWPQKQELEKEQLERMDRFKYGSTWTWDAGMNVGVKRRGT